MRSIYERENFTTHHQLECKQISGSQTFRSTQESNVIGSDDFLLHHAKLHGGGVQSQKLAVQLPPCYNIEQPPVPAPQLLPTA